MDGQHATQASILIVDDDPTNVALLDRLLRRAGFGNLMGTTDARMALSLFGSGHPDLVLLDLGMPHLDGFQVIERLRATENAAVPILVITADASPEARSRAIELGAQDLVAKPFDTTDLLCRITSLLRSPLPTAANGKDIADA